MINIPNICPNFNSIIPETEEEQIETTNAYLVNVNFVSTRRPPRSNARTFVISEVEKSRASRMIFFYRSNNVV